MPDALLNERQLPRGFFGGIWAAKITIPVRPPKIGWGHAIELVDEFVELRCRIQRYYEGDELYTDTFTPCSIEFPRYRVRAKERRATEHRLVLANNTFDQGFFPVARPVALRGAGHDSFAFTSDVVSLAAGLKLNDPATDPWPNRQQSEAAVRRLPTIDEDLDGRPGLAFQPSLQAGLQAHPGAHTGWLLSTLHAALRIRFSLHLDAKGANEMRGTVDLVGDELDTLVLAVESASDDGRKHRETDPFTMCEMAQDFRLFYDRARPAVAAMRRVATNVSLGTIREMSFP